MRNRVKYAVWLLLPMLVAGCDHKDKTQPASPQSLAPPIVDTPPPPPTTVSKADLPPPEIGTPTQPKPTETAPVEPPKKPVHKPKKPAATPPPAETTATATPPATPSVSAAGHLSGGGSEDLRSETEESVTSTEKGVNAITRPLSDAELKTVGQIRDFLKQAREALSAGDVDGAQTLVKKAKVLLAELNQ